MPNVEDLVPQLPWEGPPIPRGLGRGHKSKIKKGYILSVIDPESNILGDIKLEGYDLEMRVARSYLIDEIVDRLPAEAFEEER